MSNNQLLTRDDLINEILIGLNKKGEVAHILSSALVQSKISSWVSCGSLIGDCAISGTHTGKRPIIPFGRLTEISGLNASGKTTMLMHIMAEVQKIGGAVALIDTEHAFDFAYAKKIGVDVEKVIDIDAVYLEDVFRKAKEVISIIRDKGRDIPILVAWDSLGASTTKEILEGDEEKKYMMVEARVISQNLKMIMPMLSQTKTALVVTNHVYNAPPKGPFTKSTLESYGGEKFKFYCSLRIRLKRTSEIKQVNNRTKTEEIIGTLVKIKIEKNKIFKFKRVATTAILGDKGFCDDYIICEAIKGKKVSGRSTVWVSPDTQQQISFASWDTFASRVMTHPEYPKYKDMFFESLFKTKYEEEVENFERKRDLAVNGDINEEENPDE